MILSRVRHCGISRSKKQEEVIKDLYSARMSVPSNIIVNPSSLIFKSDEDTPVEGEMVSRLLEAGKVTSVEFCVVDDQLHLLPQ